MLLLEIAGLTSHYGRFQALDSLSIAIPEGELVALIGANGAGKTTLLRAISGVQPISGGGLSFEGRCIRRLAPEQRVDLGIIQVPEGRQVFTSLSVEDNLRLGAYRRRGPDVAADIARMIELFPVLGARRRLAAGTLSGGQQQMLALARALMTRPRLLLLDEPSMGLSPVMVREVYQAIAALKRDGTTILLVEQNAHAALAVADRAHVMETGTVVLTGTGAELLADDRVRAAYLGL
ncbi:MAG: leucine/isoleucine/valine transporter subunit [Pseudomonadota bacterium]|jgi:branched-chain amino acid transport system ATP-binding protein